MVTQGIVTGIDLKPKDVDQSACHGCVHGKGHSAFILKSSKTRSTAFLQLIHTDVMGPINIPSIGESRYIITFIDVYSK